MENYFKSRRTIRKYTSQPVDESLVSSIVEEAMRAPTCGNMQLYSVIATYSDEMKQRLAPLHFNQPMVKDCAVMLTVCADYERFCRWCEASNATPGYDNFLSFLNALTDALLLSQQIVTIAEMKGLGTCYLGTVTYNAAEIARVLELPRRVVPVACITIGYPDSPGEETERLPVEAVLYNERYPRLSDAQITEFYRAKDEYAPNRKFIEENGKQTLAQVFTDIRYPKQMNEDFSKAFLEFLKHQNFLP